MERIYFVTENSDKFDTARRVLLSSGITLEQSSQDIDEIQSEHIEKIALDKARKAYNILQQPLFVSDDSWNIVGLRGFPGPYMKSVTH